MKTFDQYLWEKGYAKNTIDSYSFAICQLIENTQALTNQSLLAHKEWLVSCSPRKPQTIVSAQSTLILITSLLMEFD